MPIRRDFHKVAEITTSAITDTVGLIHTETGLISPTRLHLTLDHDTATNTIAAFRVQVRTHAEGPWVTYLETTGWDAASTNKLLIIQGDPVGLSAANGPVLAVIELHGLEAVRFHAQAGTGTVGDLTLDGTIL